MQRVIVTVKRRDETRVRDVEVPAEIETERLAEMIARAMRWESDPMGQPLRYTIEAHPLGRMLDPEESLMHAGVWDGAWLVLHPVKEPVAPLDLFPLLAPEEEPQLELSGNLPQSVASPFPFTTRPLTTSPLTPPEGEAPAVTEAAAPGGHPDFEWPIEEAAAPWPTDIQGPHSAMADAPADTTVDAPADTPPSLQPDPWAVPTASVPPGLDESPPDWQPARFSGPSLFELPTLEGQAPLAADQPQPSTPAPDLFAPTVSAPADFAPTGFAQVEQEASREGVSGWRSLGLDLPTLASLTEEEPEATEERPSSGFAWRQLDD